MKTRERKTKTKNRWRTQHRGPTKQQLAMMFFRVLRRHTPIPSGVPRLPLTIWCSDARWKQELWGITVNKKVIWSQRVRQSSGRHKNRPVAVSSLGNREPRIDFVTQVVILSLWIIVVFYLFWMFIYGIWNFIDTLMTFYLRVNPKKEEMARNNTMAASRLLRWITSIAPPSMQSVMLIFLCTGALKSPMVLEIRIINVLYFLHGDYYTDNSPSPKVYI